MQNSFVTGAFLQGPAIDVLVECVVSLYQALLTISTPEEFESHTTGINAVLVLRKSSCGKMQEAEAL